MDRFPVEGGGVGQSRSVNKGTVTPGANTFTGIQTMPGLSITGLTGALAGMRFVGATVAGAPTSGTFLPDDAVLSVTDGKWYVCTVGGTPGTWISSSGGGTAGGDLSGTYPNPTVAKLNTVAAAAVTTKGDLLATNATPGLARLAIGADSYVLTADSTQTTGMKWAVAGTGGPPSGTAGGDLSGTYPNPTVAKLNGVVAASYALLAGPALTGVPTAPTAGALNNSTQLATTAYGDAAVAVEKTRALAAETQETVNTVAVSGAAQTIPNVTVATMNQITLSANCTFTFPTAVAGKSFLLALKQDVTGARLATWPSSATLLWSGGTAPTLSTVAAKTDSLSFICVDGTHWLGFVAGLNF